MDPVERGGSAHNQIRFETDYLAMDPAIMVADLSDLDTYLPELRRRFQAERLFWDDEMMERIRGARVLEIGGGDGRSALTMLMSGARQVTLQEITPSTERLAGDAARQLGVADRLEVVIGNPMDLDFGEPYDVVVGHLVFHHIPTDLEVEFAQMMADNTADDGWLRIVDPAVNWKALDDLRWILPAPGRPSKLSPKWAEWKAADEHPERDNSTEHVRSVFQRCFRDVQAETIGGVSRLHRWVDSDKYHEQAMQWLNRVDTKMPQSIQRRIASQHVITATGPIRH